MFDILADTNYLELIVVGTVVFEFAFLELKKSKRKENTECLSFVYVLMEKHLPSQARLMLE